MAREEARRPVRAGAVATALRFATLAAFAALSVRGIRAYRRAPTRSKAWQSAGRSSGREEDEVPRENPAIRTGVTAISMFAFFIFVALSIFGLHAFYESLALNAHFIAPRDFASPPLIIIGDDVRDAGVRAQRAELDTYKWIDRSNGVFQAPIARAMEIVAARGAKAYDPVPQPKASP